MAAVALAVALTVWRCRPVLRGSTRSAASAETARHAGTAAGAGGVTAEARDRARRADTTPLVSAAAALPPDDPRAIAVAQLAQTEALYAETMTYPEWSRPADATTRHLTAWNQLPVREQAFTHVDGDPAKPAIHGELRLNRMFVGPAETLEATVEVFVVAGQARQPTPAVVAGELQYMDGDRWVTAADVPFVADGARWVARVQPGQVAALAAAPRLVQFVAWVAAGEHRFPFASPFAYTAAPAFAVTGWEGDAIVDGSLTITLAAEAMSLDPVRVTATLFDAAGRQPIAVFDDYLRPTALGRQAIELRFFGKALRAAGVDGPYRLGALHGFVRVFDAEPGERYWATPDTPAFVTRPYRAADFSDAGFQDAATAERLDSYQRLADELVRGGA